MGQRIQSNRVNTKLHNLTSKLVKSQNIKKSNKNLMKQIKLSEITIANNLIRYCKFRVWITNLSIIGRFISWIRNQSIDWVKETKRLKACIYLSKIDIFEYHGSWSIWFGKVNIYRCASKKEIGDRLDN